MSKRTHGRPTAGCPDVARDRAEIAEPGRLGYTRADGPHPYGTSVHLPEPFDLDLDTSSL